MCVWVGDLFGEFVVEGVDVVVFVCGVVYEYVGEWVEVFG